MFINDFPLTPFPNLIFLLAKFCTCAKPCPFMETSGSFFEFFETTGTGGYQQNQIPAPTLVMTSANPSDSIHMSK
jgi:hypothetical protein